MNDMELNICACMGPHGNDPYCPCAMSRQGLDGDYNCHGNKEAMARRRADAEERLKAALHKMSPTTHQDTRHDH